MRAMTYYAYDGSSRGWNTSGRSFADEFKSLGGDLDSMEVGAQYGDDLYRVVGLNADQPFWGNSVPKGYEKVAYMDTDPNRDDKAPGKALLRKIGGSLAKPETAAPKPQEEAKLDTEAIAAARAKADEVRRGSLATAVKPTPAPSLSPSGPYDTIYAMGQDKDYQFSKLIDQLKADAIEQSVESATALRFGLDRLTPDLAIPKVIDPWEAYERFKGDIKA